MGEGDEDGVSYNSGNADHMRELMGRLEGCGTLTGRPRMCLGVTTNTTPSEMIGLSPASSELQGSTHNVQQTTDMAEGFGDDLFPGSQGTSPRPDPPSPIASGSKSPIQNGESAVASPSSVNGAEPEDAEDRGGNEAVNDDDDNMDDLVSPPLSLTIAHH